MTIDSRLEMLADVYYVCQEMLDDDSEYEERYALQQMFIKLCKSKGIPLAALLHHVHESYRPASVSTPANWWMSGWMTLNREDIERIDKEI